MNCSDLRSPALAVMACAIAAPATGAAASRDQAMEAEIGRCIRQAADGKPWLERTLWGLRDAEGGWVGAEIANSNGSHDLGPLQINSWWVPKLARLLSRSPAAVRHWLRFDPCYNVDAARWIFLQALAATNDYWEAVGRYHSPTIWRQRRYAAQVYTRMKRRSVMSPSYDSLSDRADANSTSKDVNR